MLGDSRLRSWSIPRARTAPECKPNCSRNQLYSQLRIAKLNISGSGRRATKMVVFASAKAGRSWFYRPAIVSSTLAGIFLIYLTSVLLFPHVPSFIAPMNPNVSPSLLSALANTRDFTPHVQKLIDDLKHATQEAELGGRPFAYTAKEREKWIQENPCRARTELPPLYARRKVKDVEPNYQWQAVIKEYGNLHRTCIRKIGNLTDYFYKKDSVPGCKFIVGESLFGLGNKITFASSLVLYGILTQRVVLFPEWSSSMPVTMCEPFEGSSWELPGPLNFLTKREMRPDGTIYVLRSTNLTNELLDWVDTGFQHLTNATAKNLNADGKMYLTEMDDAWHPVDRFWCDAEQEFVSRVRWMTMAGCFYFMPKLFSIPMFQPTLEELFPDKMALTHLLRSVFLPNNAAWDRVKKIDDMFFEKADKRVSIQVRYRNGDYDHKVYSKAMNEHITKCLLDNEILPRVTTHFSEEIDRAHPLPRPIVKVLITSLFLDFQDHLSNMYLRHQTLSGENVGLMQLTHDDEQRWGLEPDTQALVEMILLSLSDEILVTPLSTFGGIAQAYGALQPYIIQYLTGEGSCIRSDSKDICYQQASTTYTCPHDSFRDGRNISEIVPYVQPCMAVDSSTGVHLITS